MDDKTSNSVLSIFKYFIKVVRKPQIIHIENCAEFTAKNFTLFCQEKK